MFAFGKEKIIEQLRKLPEEDQECIIRTKPHPTDRFTMKLGIDSDYDDFNLYSVEIAVKGKELWANDQKMTMFELMELIETKYTDLRYRVDTRISLTQNSDDQTVRDLFRDINWYGPYAELSIGIK